MEITVLSITGRGCGGGEERGVGGNRILLFGVGSLLEAPGFEHVPIIL